MLFTLLIFFVIIIKQRIALAWARQIITSERKNKMKRNTLVKVILLVLVSLFVVSLAACTGGGDDTEKVTIYLDPNGGTLPAGTADEFEVAIGESIGKLPTPTRGGYEFLGWYEDGNERWEVDRRTKAEYEMEIVALWQAKGDLVTVEFKVSGDEELLSDVKFIEIVSGERISSSTEIDDLPKASLLDHKFLGWKDANGNVVSITTKIEKDTVLTPMWEKIIYCKDGTENHNWGGWMDYSEASCTEPALSMRECDICYHKEYKTDQEAYGHDWDDWAVTFSEDDGMVLSRVCDECGENETNAVDNITFSKFKTPVIDGTGWGMSMGGSLIDKTYTDKNICGNGTGAVTVTMEAKEAVYVDMFAVTGYGTASYFVTAFYDDGTSEEIDMGSFGSGDTATKAFDVKRVVTKFVVTMPACSNGQDYWSELSALVIPEL